MALARPLPPLWQALLPAAHGGAIRPPALDLPLLQRLSQPFSTPFVALAAPSLSLPALPSLADIWDGLLQAVPKNKTSYMKKRKRFMTGKGLKDITSLNKCAACGRVKRAHILCPYCVDAIKTNIFGQHAWSARQPTQKQQKQLAREEREERRRKRTVEADPRKEKEDAVIKHAGWQRYTPFGSGR